MKLQAGTAFRVQVVNSLQMLENDHAIVRGFPDAMRVAADLVRVHGGAPGSAFAIAAGVAVKRPPKKKIRSQADARRRWRDNAVGMMVTSLDELAKEHSSDEIANFFLEAAQAFEEGYRYLYQKDIP